MIASTAKQIAESKINNVMEKIKSAAYSGQMEVTIYRNDTPISEYLITLLKQHGYKVTIDDNKIRPKYNKVIISWG